MRSFFYGWRRKTGCVALLFASLSMFAWVRSLVTQDGVLIRTDTDTAYYVQTKPHLIHWYRMVAAGTKWGIMDNDIEVTLPFWYFTIPLTLLSAILILWPPPKPATVRHNVKA